MSGPFLDLCVLNAQATWRRRRTNGHAPGPVDAELAWWLSRPGMRRKGRRVR